MSELLSISGGTALLAIIGDPVAQVRAPLMINSALIERGLAQHAVMVPLHVHPGGLAAAVAGLRATQNFRGAIITMPHKAALLPLLDEITPEACQVGACNVVRRDSDGRLIGSMFDGEGLPPLVAAEIVTHPEITPFLALAAHAGCNTQPGRPMLAAQMTLMLEFMGL